MKGYEYTRNQLISDFKKLGFANEKAFCNVCRSIDVTLNWFHLNQFYNGYEAHPSLLARVESIIEFLKNE